MTRNGAMIVAWLAVMLQRLHTERYECSASRLKWSGAFAHHGDILRSDTTTSLLIAHRKQPPSKPPPLLIVIACRQRDFFGFP